MKFLLGLKKYKKSLLLYWDTGDVGWRDRWTGRNTKPGVRVAVERSLLPIVQKMLLRVPLRPHRPVSLSLPRSHLRLPRVSGESTTFFSIYARSMLFLTSLHNTTEQRSLRLFSTCCKCRSSLCCQTSTWTENFFLLNNSRKLNSNLT